MPVQTVLRAHRQIALSADLVPLFGEEAGRGGRKWVPKKFANCLIKTQIEQDDRTAPKVVCRLPGWLA